jgi:hypothetical protein
MSYGSGGEGQVEANQQTKGRHFSFDSMEGWVDPTFLTK